MKEFARQARPDLSSPIPIPGLSLHQLIDICRQVAAGLSYLSTQKFVHRDIAARNCLVAEKEDNSIVVKIADFGLAEDIYESDYCRRKGGRLPFRWMSPEAITDGRFTVKSDMWSFGVLMWEVFSFGFTPYFGTDNERVRSDVAVGVLSLNCPPGCPEKVYDLMSSCWKIDVGDRIGAEEMEKKLKVLNDMLREFGQDVIGAKPIDKKSMQEFIQSGGYQSSDSTAVAFNKEATIFLPVSGDGSRRNMATAAEDGYAALNKERVADGGHYQKRLTVNEAYQCAN